MRCCHVFVVTCGPRIMSSVVPPSDCGTDIVHSLTFELLTVFPSRKPADFTPSWDSTASVPVRVA